jgi:hypothetical protein
MKLYELFDATYKLVPTEGILKARLERLLTLGGLTDVSVMNAKENPEQIFMIGKNQGAWEVHHAVIAGQRFVSGQILNKSDRPNPKFIGTALNLYKSKVSNGENVRIIGTAEMWPVYEKVIGRIIKQYPEYVAEPVHTYSNHGIPTVSQLIRRG